MIVQVIKIVLQTPIVQIQPVRTQTVHIHRLIAVNGDNNIKGEIFSPLILKV